MAQDLTISALPQAATLGPTDQIPIVQSGVTSRLPGSALLSQGKLNAGFDNFFFTAPTPPAVPIAGLTVTLPGGSAIVSNLFTPFAAQSVSVPDNSIMDIWLNSDGTIVIQTQPLSNYPALPHYADKFHIWKLQAQSGNITGIFVMGNTTPQMTRTTDIQKVGDQLSEFFQLGPATTPWSANMLTSYDELLLTSTGLVYQVYIPPGGVQGTTGTVEPTSRGPGLIQDGTAYLYFYCTQEFLGNWRYGPDNGTFDYFSKIAAKNLCGFVTQTGVNLATAIKTFILQQFFHVIANWAASGTYSKGQKVVADGYIWVSTTPTGTTAATTAAFTAAQPHSVGQLVTDGTITWKAIYQHYGTHQWFWMHIDALFQTYTYPDAHDSDASTLISLIWRYIQFTKDYAWLTTASPIPGYTYQQCLAAIFDMNLFTQLTNAPNSLAQLTNTFQGQISPVDGSLYNIMFLEDNCESYSGFVDAQSLFTLLGDATRATNASTGAANVNAAIAALYNTTYNVFATNYGQDPSTFATNMNIGFYPYIQAQYFPELHRIPSINADSHQLVRNWVYQRWPSVVGDRGKDTTAATFLGYMAARFWQDPVRAQQSVEIVERYFLGDGSTNPVTSGISINITDWSYYLMTKNLLIPGFPLLSGSSDGMFFETPGGGLLEVNTIDKLRTTAAVAVGTLGTVSQKFPAYDQYGNLLGYIPLYN